MKLFTWMQNKLSGRHVVGKKPNSSSNNYDQDVEHCPHKEEAGGWPSQTFLAIGTFGNSCSKDDTPTEEAEEELDQYELNLFIETQDENGPISNVKSNGRLQRSTSIVANRGRDVYAENSNNGPIGKKSLSFLLKKMFVCSSGFAPPVPSSLKDPVPASRMEKIFRALLYEKIHPQNSSSATKSSTRKYLDSKQTPAYVSQDDTCERGSKWDKTDSEYIVLEI